MWDEAQEKAWVEECGRLVDIEINAYLETPVQPVEAMFDYLYADMPADAIDAAVANGAKGIVIAGVGNGNMNKASVDAAARAVQAGVTVVRSSRVATGSVGRNIELDDDKLGFIASDELNPQKARILLALSLLKPRDPAATQKLFYTY